LKSNKNQLPTMLKTLGRDSFGYLGGNVGGEDNESGVTLVETREKPNNNADFKELEGMDSQPIREVSFGNFDHVKEDISEKIPSLERRNSQLIRKVSFGNSDHVKEDKSVQMPSLERINSQPIRKVSFGNSNHVKEDKSEQMPSLEKRDSQLTRKLSYRLMRPRFKKMLSFKSVRFKSVDFDSVDFDSVDFKSVDMKCEEDNLNLSGWVRDNTSSFSDRKASRSLRNVVRRRKETSHTTNNMLFWTEHFFYTVLAIVIQITFGHEFAFPDGRPACNRDDELHRNNMRMCDLLYTLESAKSQLKFLAPFILGGFVVSTVHLWRLRRTAYTALCGATRNINVNIASLLPIDEQDKSIKYARMTMARWSVLGYEFSVLKARGQMDTDDAKFHLECLGLLAEGEWEAMVPGDRHTSVWLWIQTKAVQLRKQGVITSDIYVQTICNAVTLIRDKANDLMSAIDRDQPFPYISICGILVNINLFLTAVWKGTLWAVWFYDEGLALYSMPKMYVEIFCLFAYSMIFGLLYDLCHFLYNPFGPRPLDIPHDIVGGGIRRMAKEFGKGCIPPTMECSTFKEHNTSFNFSERQQQESPSSSELPIRSMARHCANKSLLRGKSLHSVMENYSTSATTDNDLHKSNSAAPYNDDEEGDTLSL